MADNILVPVTQFLEESAEAIQTIDETGWGPWKLDRATEVVYVDDPYHYVLTLDHLKSQHITETLRHIFGKTWATNEYLGGLARAAFAIEFAVGDPIHKAGEPKA